MSHEKEPAMTAPLLKVEDLRVTFGAGDETVKAVDGIGFQLQAGKTRVLLGESGSGKSVTALAVMGLLPAAAKTSGHVYLDGTDLMTLPGSALRGLRGKRIAMIFQEPQSSLNPVMSVGRQIGEAVKQHQGLGGRAQKDRVVELLRAVGIPEPERRRKDYPHRFSGGMKQRIMIAMALAGDPELLIADEPTTALDVTTQAQILDLLRRLQRDTGMSLLFITHDLGVAAQMGDDIAVMHDGRIVEDRIAEKFFAGPAHPYSRRLFDAIPGKARRDAETAVAAADGETGEPVLVVENLKVHFTSRQGLFNRTVAVVRAVDGVSLSVGAGRTVAVVGESGSGKTTLGKAVLQLLRPGAGRVVFLGEDLMTTTPATLRRSRAHMQIVFQDPYSSMDPRMTIADIVMEGMAAQGIGTNRRDRLPRVDTLLQQVGLQPRHKFRYPHEFSGGQRQRICIARALAAEPKLIVCDEPTSALDVSVQWQILQLLKKLQAELGVAYLFITHNISVVEYLAHYVAVMHQGRIVEQGSVDMVLYQTQHEYTKKLLAAVPRIRTGTEG